jgi:hypothetical protein
MDEYKTLQKYRLKDSVIRLFAKKVATNLKAQKTNIKNSFENSKDLHKKLSKSRKHVQKKLIFYKPKKVKNY